MPSRRPWAPNPGPGRGPDRGQGARRQSSVCERRSSCGLRVFGDETRTVQNVSIRAASVSATDSFIPTGDKPEGLGLLPLGPFLPGEDLTLSPPSGWTWRSEVSLSTTHGGMMYDRLSR